MRNIKLSLVYDGTAYLGWQKTEMGPSIEETIEKAFSKVLQHRVHVQAASRTDAGVHAVCQTANFFTHKDASLDKLKYSINCILPKDIAIKSMMEAPASFHPTLDCKSKEYHYRVCYGAVQMPHDRCYEWHYSYMMDLETINEVIPTLIGEHDFSSFCNTSESNAYAHYHRFIQSIEVLELSHQSLLFKIKGNNFLYKMIRNLVGTLIYVGSGKIKKEEMTNILLSKDRTKAGITAPAHGLYLFQVNY